jgi:hypothetical protein
MLKRVLLITVILVLAAGACTPGTVTIAVPSSATVPATLTPSPTDTAIATTATLCPFATAEPLWVDPVTSPTDQLSQVITVNVGLGEEVTVTTESGTFTVTGSFDFHANPARVEITLLPNTTHHINVSARIKTTSSNGCTYGGYTLQTTSDRHGAPLVIVQGTPAP